MSKVIYWLGAAYSATIAAAQLLPTPSPSVSPSPYPPYTPPEETKPWGIGTVAGVVGGIIGGTMAILCVCKYFCPDYFASCIRSSERMKEIHDKTISASHNNPAHNQKYTSYVVEEWTTHTVELAGKHPGEVDTWKFNSEHGNH